MVGCKVEMWENVGREVSIFANSVFFGDGAAEGIVLI